MSSIVIRRGLPSDLAAMYALDLECFEPPFVFSRQAMRRFALQANATVLVVESGQAMAGFVIVHVERRGALTAAYVTTLDVAAKHRRAGLARRLMQMAEGAATDAGAGHVWLHVFTENAAAIRFYETCGYTREVHVPGFYGAGRSAYVYGKELKVPDRGMPAMLRTIPNLCDNRPPSSQFACSVLQSAIALSQIAIGRSGDEAVRQNPVPA